MASPAERIHHPISTKELERRWAAVRAAMKERGIDALLMQNNNDFMGGYVKYFTDLPATHGYPQTVVFPAEDGMTVIIQSKFGDDQKLPPEGNWLRRGVKRVLGAPYFSSAYYTLAYDASGIASVDLRYRTRDPEDGRLPMAYSGEWSSMPMAPRPMEGAPPIAPIVCLSLNFCRQLLQIIITLLNK